MTMDNFTLEQREILIRAQKVVDDASEEYIEILKQNIQELKKSLKSDNLSEAIHFCYRIQSQAGTFAWPLATEISGWFKRLLTTQKETGLNSTINILFLDSFDVIIKQELKAESDAAVKLLLHIETQLKKQNIR